MLANASFSALAIFQDVPASLASDAHWQTIFLGIIAIVMLIVFLGLVAAALVVYGQIQKAKKQIATLQARLEAQARPLITKTQDFVTTMTPKVTEIVENVRGVSTTVRTKVDEVGVTVTKINEQVKSKVEEIGATVTQINGTVQDTNNKTKAQVSRVNGLVSDALSTTQEISQTVTEGIRAPLRQIAGWVASLKTNVDTLIEKTPFAKKLIEKIPSDK